MTPDPESQDRALDRWLIAIVIAGLTLRLIAFWIQQPFNNDDHIAVVRYVVEHGRVPVPVPGSPFELFHHPPLYYLIAAPMLALGGVKHVQALSLLFGAGALLLGGHLIARAPGIGSRPARRHAMLLLALLPQLVHLSAFVSNDALATLIGAGILLAGFAYIEAPSAPRRLGLAALTGLGLLSKGSFLAFLPAVTLLMLWVESRDRSLRRALLPCAKALALCLALGSYKYLENILILGTPLFHNLDREPSWVLAQRGTIQGLSSFVDFDLVKLALHPTFSEKTRHSVPLLLYGSFWFKYIPEGRILVLGPSWRWIGGLIVLAAALPTALLLSGCWVQVRSGWSALRGNLTGNEQRRAVAGLFALGLLAGNLGIVLVAGVRYDAWSCFMSRLLMPSAAAAALALATGYEHWRISWPRGRNLAELSLWLLWALYLSYYLAELGLQRGWL